MVDALVLGTSAFGRVGSSPTFPTKFNFNSGGGLSPLPQNQKIYGN